MQNNTSPKTALLNLGFRPFFLVAGIFSVVSVLIWLLVYTSEFELPIKSLAPFQWHAHEMIYGYSLAVIAGFLLTASKNWTGVQTLNGKPLLLLVCLWIVPRVLLLFGQTMLAGFFDLAFNLALALAILHPIYKVKQWRQKGIVAILVLFFIGNFCFYLGIFNVLTKGVNLGIYSGLYLILAIVFIMVGRVVPMFIQNGVDADIKLRQFKAVNTLSMPVLMLYIISELFIPHHIITAYLAFALFVLLTIRLIGWHTHGIWNKTLLWSLYLSLWSISLGFFLVFCSYTFGTSKYLAIHAFAYGGIGAITLAMMSRVAFGHTGHNLNNPPKLMGYAFVIMLLGAISRVLLPMIIPSYYLQLIIVSQVLWILAFVIFIIIYTPILLKPRPDGKFG